MQIQPNRPALGSSVTPVRPVAPASAPQTAEAETPMAPKSASDAPIQDSARTTGLARIDGFRDAVIERIRNAAADVPGESEALREAATFIDHGLERLRNGFAGGTLDRADVDRGLGNIFGGATEIMARERKADTSDQDADAPKDAAADASAAGAPAANTLSPTAQAVQARLNGFAAHVDARIQDANYPDAERASVAEKTRAIFDSAVSRLDAAVFAPGTGDSIDRTSMSELFAATFQALQNQIVSLLGDAQKGATLYDAQRGTDAAQAPTSSVDLAG